MKLAGDYEFRPALWPTLATLLVLPLLLALGFWQLDRAEQKAELQADFQARNQQPILILNRAADRDQAETWYWRRVRLRGEYLHRNYLLDNQTHAGTPGYRLYTPLRLANTDDVVLVERGWRPLGPDRRHVPEINTRQGTIEIEGRVAPPPAAGLMLAEHRIEQLAPGIFRLQRIEPAELAEHGGTVLLPYIVRQDETGRGQDDPALATEGFGRERHLGYAFQWFALAATLLVIYFCVNIRKRHQ